MLVSSSFSTRTSYENQTKKAITNKFVAQAMTLLPPPPYTDATWGEWTTAVKEATGRKGKGLFMPLRKAVTGQASGPEMADVMPLLQVVKARG